MNASFGAFQKPQAALLLLRWTLAILMLLHGIAKLSGGVEGIGGMLQGAGLPSFIAYGAYIGEVVAPLMLLAGLLVVPAALVIAFNMVMAIVLAHSSHLFALTDNGGWRLELQAFFLVSAIVVAMTTRVAGAQWGPGRV
ncbi:MAG: DoxX family protein [Comamonadaceae bacterium]|nr:MAG: DoxX family protein [Comamonadaceae bacterium]